MPDEPKIQYNYFTFPDQTIPNGKLMPALECQAAWYYYALAQKVWATDKDGEILLEGELWLDPQYEQIAYSVTIIYGLSSPDDFMKFMPIVALECERLGMMLPQKKYLLPRRLQ